MNRVSHFEIPADDPEACISFYKEVFNWTFNKMPDVDYWLATTGEEGTPGINGAIMKKNQPGQPVTNVIGVSDIDAAARKIEQAGGKIVVPKTLIPDMGSYAYFVDPAGNIFGLWEDVKSS